MRKQQPPDKQSLEAYSGVSTFNGEPFVMLQWGSKTGQLSPDEAQKLGMQIIAVAAASEVDAACFAEMTEALQLPKEVCIGFLQALRKRTDRD